VGGATSADWVLVAAMAAATVPAISGWLRVATGGGSISPAGMPHASVSRMIKGIKNLIKKCLCMTALLHPLYQ
jgi:hypothetical protein